MACSIIEPVFFKRNDKKNLNLMKMLNICVHLKPDCFKVKLSFAVPENTCHKYQKRVENRSFELFYNKNYISGPASTKKKQTKSAFIAMRSYGERASFTMKEENMCRWLELEMYLL